MAATYLESTATLAQAQTAYKANCMYDLEGDTDKCRMFINAVRVLQLLRAEESQKGPDRVREDYRKLEGDLKRATEWLAQNDPSTTSTDAVRYMSVENFRT
ncbi:MAG: hypothetical protein AMXMBFR84_37770 [Candidatus Hydrogenedentota bacterium]